MPGPNFADAEHPAIGTTMEDAGQVPSSPPHRRPPPMRVVTKGWWTLDERQADIEELEGENGNG